MVWDRVIPVKVKVMLKNRILARSRIIVKNESIVRSGIMGGTWGEEWDYTDNWYYGKE